MHSVHSMDWPYQTDSCVYTVHCALCRQIWVETQDVQIDTEDIECLSSSNYIYLTSIQIVYTYSNK